MSPRLVLVGPPGAGKSTVGRLLAARWSVEFADSDAEIERELGRSISEVFVDEGEEFFRGQEERVIAALLDAHDGVLALGGGAVISDRTRALLAPQDVVFLSAGLAAAAQRVGLNRDRPLLLGNIRGTLAAMLAERTPMYTEVATWTVETDDQTPEQVADAIEALMSTEGPRP
jgi:shikimate kinase